jgi:biotin carboxyl carrier protein
MKYFVTVGGREFAVEMEGEHVRIDGRSVLASLRPRQGTPLRHLTADGRTIDVALDSLGRGRWVAGVRGEHVELEVLDERTRHLRSLTAAARPAGGGIIRAPMPGLVARVLVEPGAVVAVGAGVLVLEAMKMENELRAPAPGVVAAVRVAAGQTVEKGEVLVELE